MPRGLAVLIVIIVVVTGAMVLLSGQAREQPTRTIETDVAVNAN